MDARRLNDILKLLGTLAAVIGAVAPFMPPKYAGLVTALGAFLAGFGTRGVGVEYQAVANDKAMAKVATSLVPPPMSERPTSPETPSVKP